MLSQRLEGAGWKALLSCLSNARGAVVEPIPEIHRAAVTTPFGFSRKQAEWLCSANHGSIRDSRPVAFSGCPRGIWLLKRVSAQALVPPNAVMERPPPAMNPGMGSLGT